MKKEPYYSDYEQQKENKIRQEMDVMPNIFSYPFCTTSVQPQPITLMWDESLKAFVSMRGENKNYKY